jgi:hypothetical protein
MKSLTRNSLSIAQVDDDADFADLNALGLRRLPLAPLYRCHGYHRPSRQFSHLDGWGEHPMSHLIEWF